MRLTPIAFGADETVTRQTLYDIWANSAVGTIQPTEIIFSDGAPPVTIDSSVTDSPLPGSIFFDQTEQLWKVFVDEIDGTGCSLWCSFGPDRFDEPMFADEPIPPYAMVLHGTTARRSAVLPGSGNAEHVWAFGINVGGTTAASGTWFPCAMEGLTYVATLDASTSASYDWNTSSVNAGVVFDKRGNGGAQFLQRDLGSRFHGTDYYHGMTLAPSSAVTYGDNALIPIVLFCPGRKGSSTRYY